MPQERELSTTMPKILLAIAVITAALNYLGLAYDWYVTYSWLDTPMHLLGGAFAGALFYYLFCVRHPVFVRHSPPPFLPVLLLGLGFVAFVGILWEFYELFADVVIFKKYALSAFPGDVHADTLKDLLNDFIGGAVALVGSLRHKPSA